MTTRRTTSPEQLPFAMPPGIFLRRKERVALDGAIDWRPSLDGSRSPASVAALTDSLWKAGVHDIASSEPETTPLILTKSK